MSLADSVVKLLSPSSSRHANQGPQPRPVCTWSAYAPQSGPSKSPFPRCYHALSTTATAAGELFLFGGFIHTTSSDDLYLISTRDASTTLLETSGEVPIPRGGHGAVLTSTNLLIWGGKKDYFNQDGPLNDSLHLLNLVSLEWTRIMANGPGPRGRSHHTVTMVGSKFFVFGGETNRDFLNDMWALDLNSRTIAHCRSEPVKSQPVWELYEPIPANEKPLPRSGHVSVTTEDYIIVFGGDGNGHHYNDTWSFNISTRKWTELQCTGSIPSPRAGHAAVLVNDIMYIFGGFTGTNYSNDLYALQLSTLRWFNFHNVGTSPLRRTAHAMASDGTRVFVLGGYIEHARSDEDENSLIHVFDTKHIKYPKPEHNAVVPNEKTTQLAWKSSTVPLTQEQPQHPKSSSSEAHSASRLQNATPAVSFHHATLQITHERNPGPNGRSSEFMGVNSKPRRVPVFRTTEDDVSEGSTEYHAKSAAPHFSSGGEVARLELERQLSISLAGQTGRDHRIAQLTDELALKSALLEQAEANAVEAARHAEPEPREHTDDRRLMRTSLVEQRDVELVDIQARLGDMQAKLDELLLSRDQQIGQHEKEVANVRAKFEANASELEAVSLRLADSEKGWTKSKEEADILRAQSATGSVNRDEDQVDRRLMERVQAIETEMASRRWNQKSIEEMDCRNEG